MADFYDVSDWNEKPWYGTKGSRNKSVLENPENGKIFYFKTSLLKPDKDYKHEFWSEIIASEIGRCLEYDILKYEIAYYKIEIGCISESMNAQGESELTEGIQYLTGYNTAYIPDNKESKKEYTFQFICEALKTFKLGNYIPEIIKIIIFDSLIGNSDRHQENWGIITYNKEAISLYKRESENKANTFVNRMIFKFFAWIFENYPQLSVRLKIKFHNIIPNKFAPIYDSGCCLGRELLDEKVNQMLNDKIQLSAYIKRGTSEIHWKGNKLSHFELIKSIKELYPTEILSEIQRVKNVFDIKKIEKIVNEIDSKIPIEFNHYKLPEERKKLIIKMVSLRFEELIKLLD